MGRQPCCEKIGLKKGPWTAEEDRKLVNFITRHGHGCWRAVPKLAGLLRCGKSCRLRWTNYLRPDLKRGFLTDAEEKVIIDLHAMIGNRWSRIASQLPGRTDNEIKNYWNTRIKKRLRQMGIDPSTHQPLDHHISVSQGGAISSTSSNPDHQADSESASSDNIIDTYASTIINPCYGVDVAADTINIKQELQQQSFDLAAQFFNDQDVDFSCLFDPPQKIGGAVSDDIVRSGSRSATRVGSGSPTSVISNGMTEEDCEEASSAMKSGGSGRPVEQKMPGNAQICSTWMNSSSDQSQFFQQQRAQAWSALSASIPPAHVQHFPVPLPPSLNNCHISPVIYRSSAMIDPAPKQELSLWSFADHQYNPAHGTEVVPPRTTHSSVDPNIGEHVQWMDMAALAWPSAAADPEEIGDDQDAVSFDELSNYCGLTGAHVGVDDFMVSNSCNAPCLQMCDEYSGGSFIFHEAGMPSAAHACQELQRLAAILDDL